MTDNDLPQSPAPQAPDVAERNVERLLEEAYRPEVPDPAFVQRVRERMAAAADRTRSSRRLPVNRRALFVLAAAAAVAGLALLSHKLSGPVQDRVVKHDGKEEPAPAQPGPDTPEPPVPPRLDGPA